MANEHEPKLLRDQETQSCKVAMLLVPFAAQSHLNMLLNLSNVISSYNIPVHVASSTQHIHQIKTRNPDIHSNDQQIIFHEFYLPSCDDLAQVHTTLPHLHQPISQLMQDLSRKYLRLVVIHDSLMASTVEEVTKIPNGECYTFHTISAFAIFYNLWQYLPNKPFVLDQSDDHFPSWIPSVKEASHASDFATFVAKEWMRDYEIEAGRLYNTSRVIDGTYVGLLEKMLPHKKHFAVGPLGNLMEQRSSGKIHKCLEWLDSQKERDSVIYVSFGTTTSMPPEQIRELAIGLERSGQKFIWMLRKADKGDVTLGSDDEDNGASMLPEKFNERVGDRGIVTGEWVPQQEILAHPSVGGFMTHCGWGSLSESLSKGVPLVAWPMHSDQPMNSVFVTQVLKAGVYVKDDFWESRGELITSDAVASSVRRLMATEGEAIRNRAREIGRELQGSMAQGGSSRSDMHSFIAHVTRP